MAGDLSTPRHLQRIWDGSPLEGRHVLVRCYHGLGDTIHFARYLPLLCKVASRVTVWAQPALLELLATVSARFELLPLTDGAPPVEYDLDIEIMELLEVFPAQRSVPYLRVPPLPRRAGFHVGLAWQGGDWDPARSIPFETLGPLVPLATFHSLQPDAPHCSTILATAELIGSLDLVITIDSMPAHLAGALAVPTWMLLPANPDWRWLTPEPWYPTVRLFRQRKAGVWEDVIEEVRGELAAIAPADPGALMDLRPSR